MLDKLKNMDKKKLSIGFIALIVVIFLVNIFVFGNDKQAEGTDGKEIPNHQSGDVAYEEGSVRLDTKKEGDTTSNEASDTTEEGTKEGEAEDPLSLIKEELDLLYRDRIPPIGYGDEYDPSETSLMKNQLLESASKGMYGEITEMFHTLTSEYKFSEGENLEIAAILQDASSVVDVFTSEESTLEDFAFAVDESYHPEMLMYGTLFSPLRERRYIIQDTDSISPVEGHGGVRVENRRVLRYLEDADTEPTFGDRNIGKELFELYDDTNSVYVYDITLLDLDTLDFPGSVYIREDLFGDLWFYGFYIDDDVEHYEQTVSYWMSLDPIYEHAEQEQDKYVPPVEGDKITREDMDRWFESGY